MDFLLYAGLIQISRSYGKNFLHLGAGGTTLKRFKGRFSDLQVDYYIANKIFDISAYQKICNEFLMKNDNVDKNFMPLYRGELKTEIQSPPPDYQNKFKYFKLYIRMEVCGMNVLFMAKETVSSILSLKYMIKKSANVIFAVIRPQDETLKNICHKYKIPIGSEKDFLSINNDLPKIDYLLSYYWKLVKAETLKIPLKGAINFHPGPLPEARGSGYHIAILNDWGYWGVTAHYMDETFDTGDIICCDRFSLPPNIVNRELVHLAHIKNFELLKKIFDKILNGEIPESTVQTSGNYYSLKDLEAGKYISENDSDEIIKRKIRAYWNPPYSGAKIILGGKEYTVIDEEILSYISNNTKNWEERSDLID